MGKAIQFVAHLRWFIPLAVMIITVVCSETYRFRHPEMTDTQLFMELWWAYLILAASTIAAIWVMDIAFKKKLDEECSSYPPNGINCRCTRPKDDG